ncbi:MAG: NAD(P)/FAD-dependent oxidoreductase [Chitinophagales bacterium]|nr:NAD(P)/FAD-dependent oxidoreductase [Chitinophagales bacterium]
MAQSNFTSYKHYKGNRHFDVIIIGSGISGIALGAILSKHGKKVLILEQHYTPGGYTHTFKRNDYEWDVGVHYVGEVGKQTLLKTVYDYVSETPIQWADMGEVYDRVFFGTESYEFRKGKKQFTEYFTQLFPEEKASIEKYVQLLSVSGGAARWFYAEKAVPKWLSFLAGGIMRKSYLKFASRTTAEVMNELFTNEKLKAVLCAQFGDYGLPPTESSFAMHAVVASHYLYGGFYPVGGSAAFFDHIAPVTKNFGGEILIRARVKQIKIESNTAKGVIMEDGKEFTANQIISTVGVVNTFQHLLPEKVVKENAYTEKLKSTKPSLTYHCLYVGLKHTAEELQLPKSNFWIFPEVYDHTKNLYDYINRKTDKLPGVYISFPAAKDPDFQKRFPGRSTIEVITLTNFEQVQQWNGTRWMHRGDDYVAFKKKISEQLLEYLYTYVPSVKGKIDYTELSTPLSAKHFANYQYGEMYGIDHDPARFENRYLKPQTDIRNFYLAGQDVVSCGVGGALMSAVLCGSAMLGKNMINEIISSAKK